MCHFHQFYKVTKTNVEIAHPFVYNVTITVFWTPNRKQWGFTPPERSTHNYVHSKRNP